MLQQKCSTCSGAGQIELAPHLSKTLRVMLKGRKYTTSAVAGQLNISHTAANNRLSKLFNFGYLRRWWLQRTPRGGREYIWERSTPS